MSTNLGHNADDGLRVWRFYQRDVGKLNTRECFDIIAATDEAAREVVALWTFAGADQVERPAWWDKAIVRDRGPLERALNEADTRPS